MRLVLGRGDVLFNSFKDKKKTIILSEFAIFWYQNQVDGRILPNSLLKQWAFICHHLVLGVTMFSCSHTLNSMLISTNCPYLCWYQNNFLSICFFNKLGDNYYLYSLYIRFFFSLSYIQNCEWLLKYRTPKQAISQYTNTN